MEVINYNFLTSDDEIKKDKNYIKISKFLSKLVENGTVNLGAGYCISMADLVKIGLRQEGIDCRLLECQLTIFHDRQESEIDFIGFDDIKHPGQVDTHVVVITETNPPFLIDASISHRLPKETPVILETLLIDKMDKVHNIVLESHFIKERIKVAYQEKKKFHVPFIHQRSIIERIDTDEKIFREISFLKKLNYIGIGVSIFALINVILNVFKIY